MSDITVQINPPATIPVSVGGGVTAHASTHAPGASDSLEAYYATTGSLAYVSGLATGISSTGYLTGYVTKTETGSLSGVFYPLTSNPSGYVQGAVVRPSNTGAFLDTGSSQTISSLKNFTVRPTVNGTGVLLSGESAINTGVLTGAFYPLNSNPSGYITGVDLSNYVTKSSTGSFVTTGQTGNFVVSSQTGAFLTTGAADARYALQSATGSFITSSQTGQFVTTGSTGQFVTGSVVRPSQTGAFLTTGAADSRYALQSATGVFVTTGSTGSFVTTSQTGQFVSTGATGNFVTGSVVRPSETGNFIVSSQTGAFLTTGAADGRYYGLSNGQSISGYAITGFNDAVTGITVTGVNTKTITLFQRDGTTLTANFTDNSASGSSDTGYLTGYVSKTETGNFVTTSQTGNFITASQTGQFVSTGSTGNFVTGTVVRPSDTGAFLTTGAADSRYALQSATGVFVTTGQTGSFVINSQTGAFLTTGAADGRYALQSSTGNFVTTGQTGTFVVSSQTGAFLTTGAGDGRYALQSATGSFITSSQTGQFVGTGSTGNFVTTSQTGSFLTNASQYVQEIYIDAGAMLTGISGATPTGVSVLNSGIAYDCYSFDAATTGFAQFKFTLDDYNLGAMKAKFHWTAPGTTTGGVVWGIQSRAVGDIEFLNSGFAGGVEVNDFFSTGTGFFTSAAATFTPSGVLASGDLFFFRVYRSVANAIDDLGANAYLLGVSIQYTGNRITAW